MNNYEYGFITKCAEYGVDPEKLIKAAQKVKTTNLTPLLESVHADFHEPISKNYNKAAYEIPDDWAISKISIPDLIDAAKSVTPDRSTLPPGVKEPTLAELRQVPGFIDQEFEKLKHGYFAPTGLLHPDAVRYYHGKGLPPGAGWSMDQDFFKKIQEVMTNLRKNTNQDKHQILNSDEFNKLIEEFATKNNAPLEPLRAHMRRELLRHSLLGTNTFTLPDRSKWGYERELFGYDILDKKPNLPPGAIPFTHNRPNSIPTDILIGNVMGQVSRLPNIPEDVVSDNITRAWHNYTNSNNSVVIPSY